MTGIWWVICGLGFTLVIVSYLLLTTFSAALESFQDRIKALEDQDKSQPTRNN